MKFTGQYLINNRVTRLCPYQRFSLKGKLGANYPDFISFTKFGDLVIYKIADVKASLNSMVRHSVLIFAFNFFPSAF
jgi:hypothetical protein